MVWVATSIIKLIVRKIIFLNFGIANDAIAFFDTPYKMKVPTVINTTMQTIISIGAGAAHNVVVTSEGSVFAVGYNAEGELGLGHRTRCAKWEENRLLKNVPVNRVYMSQYHCFLTSTQHQVFAFGINRNLVLDAAASTSEYIDAPREMACFANVPLRMISTGFVSSAFFVTGNENGSDYLFH